MAVTFHRNGTVSAHGRVVGRCHRQSDGKWIFRGNDGTTEIARTQGMLEKAAIQSFRIQVRSELNEYLKDTSQRKIKEKQELAARIRQRDAEDQRWKAMIEDEKSRQEIAAKRRAEERTEREARWAKLKAKWAAIGKPEK